MHRLPLGDLAYDLCSPVRHGEIINFTKYGAKIMKNALDEFTKKFGEGTAFDLDWGKLLIIGLLGYHIFFQTN